MPHVEALIAESIAPAAATVDVDGVQRVHLDYLADAGLLGTALPPFEQREVAELIAMADASTWFCWVQHQTPLSILRESPLSATDTRYADLLESLEAGVAIAGVAFAHLRRPGPPNPVATRADGGWLVTGTLDWVTSWDIADLVLIMVRAESSILCFFVTAGEVPSTQQGITVGEPLRLLSMGGTHTRPLHLFDHVVPDSDVVALLDLAEWSQGDSVKTANATPAIFGIARGAISELDDLATQRADARLRQLTDRLAMECESLRSQAYRAIDADARVDTRLAIRALALDHLMRATTAVVTARAGAAMLSGSSAERRVREALFMQVQAQTAVTRAAMIDLALER